MGNQHTAYKYRQGNGWIYAIWDESVKAYRLSNEVPYLKARSAVGAANCPHKTDGKCTIESHCL